jgi:hypothetical protein
MLLIILISVTLFGNTIKPLDIPHNKITLATSKLWFFDICLITEWSTKELSNYANGE